MREEICLEDIYSASYKIKVPPKHQSSDEEEHAESVIQERKCSHHNYQPETPELLAHHIEWALEHNHQKFEDWEKEQQQHRLFEQHQQQGLEDRIVTLETKVEYLHDSIRQLVVAHNELVSERKRSLEAEEQAAIPAK